MTFLKKIIPQSRYARNVITLMTGTGLAQAIPIAVSPILTRIYTPEDFGKFALYISLASILSIFVTGRYELAISLPKNHRDAFHIVSLSILLTIFLSIILLIIILLFSTDIVKILGNEEFVDWLYWIPISTFLSGVHSNLNYWNNRKELYRDLAISRITQSTGGATTQLSMSLINHGSIGLLVGQLIGQLLSIIYLIKSSYTSDKLEVKNLKWRRILILLSKYKDFPRIMIVAHGFNTASGQMPVMLLGTLFNITIAGYYMLIQRLMGVPMALISSAFGDIFRQEASKEFIHTGNCRLVYEKTLKRLLLIATLPFLIFFFIAPDIFGIFFGPQWKVAGEYAQILTPMFFLQFVTSPLSSMFMIAQKQKIDLCWQIFLLIFVLLALIIGAAVHSISVSLSIFSAVYCVMYIVNAIIAYQLTIKIQNKK